jgi:hypothetical protein
LPTEAPAAVPASFSKKTSPEEKPKRLAAKDYAPASEEINFDEPAVAGAGRSMVVSAAIFNHFCTIVLLLFSTTSVPLLLLYSTTSVPLCCYYIEIVSKLL